MDSADKPTKLHNDKRMMWVMECFILSNNASLFDYLQARYDAAFLSSV